MSLRNQSLFQYKFPNPEDSYCQQYRFKLNNLNLNNLSDEAIVINLTKRVFNFLTTTPPRLFLWPDQSFYQFYENRLIEGLTPQERPHLLCYSRFLIMAIKNKYPFIRLDQDLVCENLEEEGLLRSYSEIIRNDIVKCLKTHRQPLIKETIDILIISSTEKDALFRIALREEIVFAQERERERQERECKWRCNIL